MYGTGSGPASSMALQHGGGALALGLPAGGLAHAHPILPLPHPALSRSFLSD